jgi:hypothetical protein
VSRGGSGPRTHEAWVWAVAAALDAGACAPPLAGRPTTLDAPTIVAVVAEPPEARPGGSVTYRAVVGSPEGRIDQLPLAWSACTTPRPLGDEGVIDPRCLVDVAARATLTGTGTTATGQMPAAACRIFGPEPPPGDFRAADPDATGGYYQPILVQGLDPEVVFGHRVRCGVPRAPTPVAAAFERGYVENRAPRIETLSFEDGRLRLSLAPEAAERYARLSPGADAVEEATERVTMAWRVSRGALAEGRADVRFTGADGARAEVEWTDGEGGTAWAVVRDDRGGVAVAELRR